MHVCVYLTIILLLPLSPLYIRHCVANKKIYIDLSIYLSIDLYSYLTASQSLEPGPLDLQIENNLGEITREESIHNRSGFAVERLPRVRHQ